MDNINLFELLQTFHPVKKLVVGFSGGIDSTALLMLLVQNPAVMLHYDIMAVHINHQVSKNAEAWEKHCATFCKKLNVPYESRVVSLEVLGESFEAVARKARYQVLSEYISGDTALLTAHHQDDQAETVLLQLLRGTGIAGIAAMPVVKPFSQGLHIRPFLSVSREQLFFYLLKEQVSWVEDESNQDFHFDRNFIRHRVIPLLQSRWPLANDIIARHASHVAETTLLLQELAERDLQQVMDKEDALNLKQLSCLSLPRQKHCLRHWLKVKAGVVPDEKNLLEIFKTVVKARSDAMPKMTFGKWALQRYRGLLHLIAKRDVDLKESWTLSWSLEEDLLLPQGLGVLQKAEFLIYQKEAPLTVCTRQTGMRVTLKNRTGHRKVKHLLQTWGVPPWVREKIVFVLAKERLIMALGYYKEK